MSLHCCAKSMDVVCNNVCRINMVMILLICSLRYALKLVCWLGFGLRTCRDGCSACKVGCVIASTTSCGLRDGRHCLLFC